MAHQRKWNVYLLGRWINAVYFGATMDAEEVKRSLVHHDGLDPRIELREG